MSRRHTATSGGPTPASRREPGTASAPRHSTATHVHDFKIVAVFEGLRESIAQCSCGETKTVFRTEADS